MGNGSDYYGIKTHASRMAPWTAKMLALLEDGEWHDREEVVLQSMAVVPPGVALRASESTRANAGKKDGTGNRKPAPEKRVKRRSHSELVAYGQRIKANEATASLAAAGRIERKTINGVKMLRSLGVSSRALIVRDGDDLQWSMSTNVFLTVVDSRTLYSKPLEELLELEQALLSHPDRANGLAKAKSMVATAIALKKNENG